MSNVDNKGCDSSSGTKKYIRGVIMATKKKKVTTYSTRKKATRSRKITRKNKPTSIVIKL